MFNAWTVFWKTFSRVFTVIDQVGETAEVATNEGLLEVKDWAKHNQVSRDKRFAEFEASLNAEEAKEAEAS